MCTPTTISNQPSKENVKNMIENVVFIFSASALLKEWDSNSAVDITKIKAGTLSKALVLLLNIEVAKVKSNT
ncbi:hypothetical protein D9M71_816590 [compost metagenome]